MRLALLLAGLLTCFGFGFVMVEPVVHSLTSRVSDESTSIPVYGLGDMLAILTTEQQLDEQRQRRETMSRELASIRERLLEGQLSLKEAAEASRRAGLNYDPNYDRSIGAMFPEAGEGAYACSLLMLVGQEWRDADECNRMVIGNRLAELRREYRQLYGGEPLQLQRDLPRAQWSWELTEADLLDRAEHERSIAEQ